MPDYTFDDWLNRVDDIIAEKRNFSFTEWAKVQAKQKDILEEVLPLFPFEYIHLGGDEVPKDRWKKCPDCQAKIKKNGLADEHALQVAFTNDMVEFMAQKGKKVICSLILT